MSKATAAEISQMLGRLEDRFWQAVHDGSIVEVMKRSKKEMLDVFAHSNSTDADIKAAFKKHTFVMFIIMDWRKNGKKPGFADRAREQLSRYEAGKEHSIKGAKQRKGSPAPAATRQEGSRTLPVQVPTEMNTAPLEDEPAQAEVQQQQPAKVATAASRRPASQLPAPAATTTAADHPMDIDKEAALPARSDGVPKNPDKTAPAPSATPAVRGSQLQAMLVAGPSRHREKTPQVAVELPMEVSSDTDTNEYQPSDSSLLLWDQKHMGKARHNRGDKGQDQLHKKGKGKAKEREGGGNATEAGLPKRPAAKLFIRRPPRASGRLNDPSCEHCDSRDIACQENVRGGACVSCRTLKMCCSIVTGRQTREQRPRQRGPKNLVPI